MRMDTRFRVSVGADPGYTIGLHVESGRWRVFNADGVATRGQFHRREQAQAWIDYRLRNARPDGEPVARSNYYAHNELTIRVVDGD